MTTVSGRGLERGGAVAPVARDEPGNPALGDPVLAGHLGLGTAFNDNSGDDQASFRHQPTLAEPARDCPPSSVGQPPTDPLITASKSVGVTPTTTHRSPTGPSCCWRCSRAGREVSYAVTPRNGNFVRMMIYFLVPWTTWVAIISCVTLWSSAARDIWMF